MNKHLTALAAALLLPLAAPQAASLDPIRVILVGDSTMATRSGYGDALCQRFSPEVTCVNVARGGRSSGKPGRSTVFSAMVATELAHAVPDIAPYLKQQ